ncbi:hypothetical protein ALC60_14642 [Trachymyrmex zeteki]|uniref:Uncharacterized protein n=1 Tax=Mycetomoellerius zeteki TaxID=64791 RepID=A0A151WEF2_9HYME|nr:hypothetical protein ALC60_14642 [Trachymyrmex zeteki]
MKRDVSTKMHVPRTVHVRRHDGSATSDHPRRPPGRASTATRGGDRVSLDGGGGGFDRPTALVSRRSDAERVFGPKRVHGTYFFLPRHGGMPLLERPPCQDVSWNLRGTSWLRDVPPLQLLVRRRAPTDDGGRRRESTVCNVSSLPHVLHPFTAPLVASQLQCGYIRRYICLNVR